jgi:hypothetical protein
MKIAKEYSNAPVMYYKPEIDKCLKCGERLKRSHRVWSKYIIQLTGTMYVVSMGYRCSKDDCSSDTVYRSAMAEALSLKYYSFGIDVIAKVGEMRFNWNRTLKEIHSELTKSIIISEREIQYLIEIYMLLITGVKQDKSYLDNVISKEGIILSIDGIQPEKGNEVLYILKDVLSGEVLCSENLLSSDEESIKGLIQPVIDLGYPILGVISDGQKSIRLAVTELMPDVPYQLCHYHYLDEVSQGLEEGDRKLKTKLKKEIRDIRTVEKRIEKAESNLGTDRERDILKDFTIAIRTTGLENSIYPFDCGGIKVYEQLVDIEMALNACQKAKDHPLLKRMKDMTSIYKTYSGEYQEVNMLFTMVKRIATLIDPDNFPEDNEVKRKQRLIGYMGYVARKKKEYPKLSAYLNHIVKVTKSFLPCLFAYLRCSQLPVTNNDLEIFHRRVKTAHRRRTGRKSSHDYIIRYGKFAVYQMGIDCGVRIKGVAYTKLKELKHQLGIVRKRYSKMYQVRHKRSEFLKSLVDRWSDISISSSLSLTPT